MRPETEEPNCPAIKNAYDLGRLLGSQGIVLLFSNRKSTEHILAKIICEFQMYKTHKIEMLGLKVKRVEKNSYPVGSIPPPLCSFLMGSYQTLSSLGNCMS